MVCCLNCWLWVWWFVFVGFVVCVLFGLVVRLACGWLCCVYVVCVGVACCLVELLVGIGYVDAVFCLVLRFVCSGLF